MIQEGDEAPGFELPAYVDGEKRRVALEDYVGQDVVILAFYPADFNPACDAESDLDELDLFTMQKDVSVLGIAPDTLYAHAAFAEEYTLSVPLLSDADLDVAEAYGVLTEDETGQRLPQRAVVVVDHDGDVTYAWSTEDLEELPDVDPIKDAIADTGGDDTAFARYRMGHAHYTEARRAFTSAMGAYQESEWMMAQSDFMRARDEFEGAAEHFNSAVRFVDDEDLETYYERTEEKATALWQAADWLGQSASAYSSGSGAEAQELKDDAERPLETARSIGDPVDPDDWPPDVDAEGGTSILPGGPEPDAELEVDIDEEAAVQAAEAAAAEAEPPKPDEDRVDIDDAELEELEAELEASQPDNPEGEELEDEPTSMVDAPPDEDDEPDDAAATGPDDGDVEDLEAEIAAGQSEDADVPAASTSMVDAPSGNDPDPDGPAVEGTDGEAPTGAEADGAAGTTDDAPPGDEPVAEEGTDAASDAPTGPDRDADDGGLDDENGATTGGTDDSGDAWSGPPDIPAAPAAEEEAADADPPADEDGTDGESTEDAE